VAGSGDQYAARIGTPTLILRGGTVHDEATPGQPTKPVCGLRVERGVGWVLIDHPPKHLVDGGFMAALVDVLNRAERDPAVHVLVFESADPDFFLMHGDVEGIMRMPHNPEPATSANPAEAIFERVRRFPKPTIGMIDGHARGGGSEFLSALDMRFAGPRTVLGQPEVPMGILPGAGGTQFLARLVGRARALEIILGGGDVYADEAAAIGYVNRVLPTADLRPFVTTLAERIAAWPPDAVQAAKRAIDAGIYAAEPQFVTETNEFRALINARGHMAPMQRFLDAGGQTREGETTRMDAIIDAMRNPEAGA
jgi:enoyl-CoA hydratase/carnithine racemase